MADHFNYQFALEMQRVAEAEFELLSSHLPFGSYTAKEVYEHFELIRNNVEAERRNSAEMEEVVLPSFDELYPECVKEVSMQMESFKCSAPRYLFFQMLHKMERLAGIGTNKRKVFIKQAELEKSADISFQVEITKSMMSLKKSVSTDGLRESLQRICLDFNKGYIVASNGNIMSVMKADFGWFFVKEGVEAFPVTMSVPAFSRSVGSLSVDVEVKYGIGRKLMFYTENGYYEEETNFKYPAWHLVPPKELFRNGRISVGKDGIKKIKSFAKQAEKNGYGPMCVKGCGNKLELSYRSYDNTIQWSYVNLEDEVPLFAIGFKPSFFKCLDEWNGTMWITDPSRMVVFDKEAPTDYYLVTPMMLDGVAHKSEINGTKVSFEDRRSEYGIQSEVKTKTEKTRKEITNPKTPIFMATDRYEGTEHYYKLKEIENGNYRVKGSHDSELMLFLRTAAHFIRQDEKLQDEFCRYCSDNFKGKDWRYLLPMEEIYLAEMFESFLSEKGIEDIPDVDFDDAEYVEESIEEVQESEVTEPEETEVEEVEEIEAEEVEEVYAEEVDNEPKSYTFCITGTLDKSRKFYQEEIESRGWRLASKMSTSVDILVYGDSLKEEASAKVKQAIKHGTKAISATEFYQFLSDHPVEVEEVFDIVETIEDVSVKPMAIETEIVPTLELETSEGTLVIAGESYFHKLYDEENGCFRSDKAEEKFDEIDAFIPDELIQAEELDYAAIAEAVSAFMDEVAAS